MKINIVLMLTGLLVTYSVYANDSVRTGLWEVTTRSDLLGLVQHVPPENMQQLQNLATIWVEDTQNRKRRRNFACLYHARNGTAGNSNLFLRKPLWMYRTQCDSHRQ